MARTLYDKIWDEHVVHTEEDGTAVLYIDRHLIHEGTSPQAFAGLDEQGRGVPMPGQNVAVVSHIIPTHPGKVRVIGASNFHAMRLKRAIDIARRDGLPRYHVLQPEYNLVSRHKFEGELQDYCVTENIGVLPYYGLASGFLTGKYRTKDDLSQSVRGGRMGELLESKGAAVLAAMDQVADETGATHAQIALAWLMAQEGVTAPIASATSVKQLEDLLPAMELDLSKDQLERLTDAGA